MADFVAVIRRAVDGLANNTPEMRVRVYEKARSAVQRQLENMKPRPSDEMLRRQLEKLDAAIAAVEAEHAEALPPEPAAPVVPVAAAAAYAAAEPSAAEDVPAEPQPMADEPVEEAPSYAQEDAAALDQQAPEVEPSDAREPHAFAEDPSHVPGLIRSRSMPRPIRWMRPRPRNVPSRAGRRRHVCLSGASRCRSVCR